MENGLVTKGARLIIPSTLRSKVLEQIHEGHLGIENVCSRQETLYFGLEFPMISGRLWRNVAFVRQAPSHPSQLEM